MRDQHRISLLESIQWGLEVCRRLYVLLQLSIADKTRVGICYDTVLVVMVPQMEEKGKWRSGVISCPDFKGRWPKPHLVANADSEGRHKYFPSAAPWRVSLLPDYFYTPAGCVLRIRSGHSQ